MISDLYTRFVSGLLFPVQEKLKSHDSLRIRKEMERTQWLSRQKIVQLQILRLKAFLTDVEKNVPYYRGIFKECEFSPHEITSISDLRRLPFLTKTEIRQNRDRLQAEDAKGLARCNTGGSSGEPLIFYLGNQRVSHDVAAKWRATRWWGVDIGDPETVVWGSPIELGAQDRMREIRDRLFRTQLLTAFDMSDSKLDCFLESIRNKRPSMLFGYPSAIAHIAAHANKKNVSMDKLGIKVVFVTAERLYDYQRDQIEHTFGCPVANGYGGRDSGFIAHECPEGGMHITAEDIIVEIVDKAGGVLPPGKAGEVVVTHLATRDFPFIRYRTGDVAVLDEDICGCGRGLPLLKDIQGRTTDFVIAQNGTVLHGLALIYVLRDLPGIEAFKIIQESLDKTRVQIVKGDGFLEDAESVIRKGFKERLGAAVCVEVEYCNEIPKEKSGKFRYVVSRVEG